MNPVTLFPAYGKGYPSAECMFFAWKIGADFTYGKNGPYCSIRNIKELSYMASSVTLMSRDGSIVVPLV